MVVVSGRRQGPLALSSSPDNSLSELFLSLYKSLPLLSQPGTTHLFKPRSPVYLVMVALVYSPSPWETESPGLL